MAYVAPTTRADGYVVDATEWNKNTVDNPIALRAGAVAIASQATGEVIYAGSSTQLARLTAGTSGQVLQANGAGAAPSWATLPADSVTVIRGFSSGTTGVQAQNTTNYYNEAWRDATEDAIVYLVGAAVTFTKLYVRTAAVVGGAAQTATFTLRKNGAATAITCQIASGAQTGNDTTHSVSFAAGDRICLECVLSATTGNVQVQAGIGT